MTINCSNIFATACQGCPNDNGGGGGGGPTYDCDTMGTILYVDISRPNNNGNGKTWATAKKYLQSALTIANNCTEIQIIRVAEGTYKPTITSTDRDLTFFVGNSFSIEGGYPTGGGAVNHVLNPTILDGELATNVNSYHIMVIYNQANVSINGFRFRNGFADGVGSIEIATGIFMSRDDGAAIYIRDNSNLKISNCAIYNNVANDDGGAIFSHNSEASFINTVFSDNTAGVNGGGIYLQTNSTVNFTNTVFVDNLYFSGGGGAIYNTVGTAVNIYNSILWDNTNSWNGGGIRNVRYSLIQDNNTFNGGVNTNNIFEVDPEFIDKNDLNGNDNIWFTDDDGLNVCTGSICLNRGLNTALNIPSQDIAKNGRIYNSQVDIGAYEKVAIPIVGSPPASGDSLVARVYSGVTSIPDAGCIIRATLEPSTSVNHQIILVAKVNASFPLYNEMYLLKRYYYLQRISGGSFNGNISLSFSNSEFSNFNTQPYSINDLPISSGSNKSHLRIIKFPGIASTPYMPSSFTALPEIIDPVDSNIVFNILTNTWKITFENSGQLGSYFITTTHDYVFNGFGNFSEETNWLNNNKPNSVLPSFNKIKIAQGAFCEFDEPLILKPLSSLLVE